MTARQTDSPLATSVRRGADACSWVITHSPFSRTHTSVTRMSLLNDAPPAVTPCQRHETDDHPYVPATEHSEVAEVVEVHFRRTSS